MHINNLVNIGIYLAPFNILKLSIRNNLQVLLKHHVKERLVVAAELLIRLDIIE